MAAALVFSSVEPPLLPGRHRRFFRPCLVASPGRESQALSDDFDFQEGMKSVKEMLHQNHKNKREVMTNIDHLKRLCIDHYFQDEIDEAMNACLDLVHSDDLLDATLSFRLVREAGYDVSADEALRKFSDNNGDFSLDLRKDTKGLLSLQDISHLNMGEESLYKAKIFSRKYLTSAIEHLDPNLARYVRQSLDHPYHVSLMQYKARHHLSYMQSASTKNEGMQELALAEFQLNKLLHQREMQEIKRGNPSLDTGLRSQKSSQLSVLWMTTLMLLQHKRSSLASPRQSESADSLPIYMRSCYNALYTITNDIADIVEREHGSCPMEHLKKAWIMLFDAFLVKAKWLSANQVPSLDEYLSNGVVTTGGSLALGHLFSMLGHDASNGSANLAADQIPPIISCPSKILRLWDDMGSAKDEAQEGLDGSYKELYLKENPGGDAEGHMLALIESEWEELNRECFSRRSYPPRLTQISLNLARMVSVLFDFDDEQRLPVLEDYIRMLLF